MTREERHMIIDQLTDEEYDLLVSKLKEDSHTETQGATIPL